MHQRLFRFVPALLIALVILTPAFGAPPPVPRAKPTPPPLWQLFNQTQYLTAERAISAARKGDWLTAGSLATATGEPVFGDVMQWLEIKDNSSHPSFLRVQKFLASHPDWPSQKALLRTAERVVSDNGSMQQVGNWFAAHPAKSSKGLRRQAEILIAQGKSKQGNKDLRALWASGYFPKAEAKSFRKSYGHLLKRKDHETRLLNLLWSRRQTEAKALYPDVRTSVKKIAEARIALQKRSKTADKLYKSLPGSASSDEGLIYDRVRFLRKMDRDDEAIKLIKAFPPKRSERATKWWTERQILARNALKLRNGRVAYSLTKDHGLASGGKYVDAEWFLGWVALRFLNDPAKALKHFQPVYDKVGTPISLSRFAYWTGRAEEALGHKEKAKNWYDKAALHPIAYYGQLASLRLGRKALTFPADPIPTDQDRQALASSKLVRAARLLNELGENDFAASFLYAATRAAKTPGEHFLLRELAWELDQGHRLVSVGKIGISEGVMLVDSAWPIYAFPPPLYGGPVPELAFIHAVSRQESALNPQAVSRAGARGLMQLMPATAKLVAKRQGVDYQKEWLVGDPVYNARLGMAHLQELANRYNGSYILMLCAYNAGPRRADEWSVTYGDPRAPATDVVDWVESIPFSETRNYVQRIIESLQVYRARLAGNQGTLQIETDLRRGS